MFPLLDMPGGWEWLIILAIVILVFGAAKLPELARGTGQALRIFKAETKGLRDGDDDKASSEADKPSQPIEGKIVETPRDTNAG
jgi:sec-independent protein translocase protein TatA